MRTEKRDEIRDVIKQLISEREQLTEEKRLIENKLHRNQTVMVERIVEIGAYHCLTVNMSRLRRL